MKILMLFLLLVLPAHAFHPTILLKNLIDQTCRQTPFYHLCVSTLKANPKSHNADVKELAEIIVEALDNKATDTLDEIKELLQGSLAIDPKMEEALHTCAERYHTIIRGDVPEALEALERGDYKYAETGTNDAAVEANSCERAFDGKSPLTDMNRAVHDLSVVAASIVKIILKI